MKAKNYLLSCKLFFLGFLILSFFSCEKENLETKEGSIPDQEVSSLPESDLLKFDDFEQMTESLMEGEKISVNGSAKNLNGSARNKNSQSYDFSANVLRGPAKGATIDAELNINITRNFRNFKIFRGNLNLNDGSKSGVRGAIINDGFVYLITRIKGIGLVRGVGTIDSDGNIAGPFSLYNRKGFSRGSWTATLKDTTPPLPTIVDLALATPTLSTLVNAVTGAGLVETLSGDGPFTVFAPTNDAFSALNAIPDGEALKQVLLYHVVSGKLKGSDLLELGEVTTVQGEKVTIELVNNEVILNGNIKVIVKDIEASNGIVHIIDGVLLMEPMEPLQSIVEIAAGNPDFSTLVGALQATELVDALSGDGPFTVFAPTNAAFDKLAAIPEGDALKEVLLYHVASGAFDAASLLEKKTVETLQGQKVTIEAKNGKVFLNDTIEVVLADIKASNGIIHVISDVLIPLQSIVEIAVGNPDFSTLVGALQTAGLVDALSGDGPFTVFAPTNAAFDKLAAIPEGEALKEVLLYHVASGAFDAASLLEKKTVETLQGQRVTIEARNGKVFLNDTIEVVLADIKASNGIIHVISDVLLPTAQKTSILETIKNNPQTSIFYNALKDSGLDKLLMENTFVKRNYTVFVPTNTVFENLDHFSPSVRELKNILYQHIVDNRFKAKKLAVKNNIRSLLGRKISIDVTKENNIILNHSATVIEADITATNGIIHIIDNVIPFRSF